MSDNGHMMHSDIIDLWPSLRAFASDAGVQYDCAQKWRWRNNIPSTYWPQIVTAARTRKVRGVSLAILAKGAQRKRSAAR
jgi:hypothetical protein